MLLNTINKYVPRFMAVLLAVLILFCLSDSVFATEEITSSGENSETEVTEESAEEKTAEETPKITSGSCGSGLNWSFNNGTLTITGAGDMSYFGDYDDVPWYELRAEILKIVLPEGLSSIGDFAFRECKNLKTASIPNSVKRIGMYAFEDCIDIEILYLGNGVEVIKEGAFCGCISINALNFPNSLETIGLKAFYRCESVSGITVPENVSNIGTAAFAYCKRLIYVDLQAKLKEIPSLLFYRCNMLSVVKLPESAEIIPEHTFRGCDSLDSVYYSGNSVTLEGITESINKDIPNFSEQGSVMNGDGGNTAGSEGYWENSEGQLVVERTETEQGEDSSVSTTVESTISKDNEIDSSNTNITVTINGENGWNEAKDILKKELDRVSAETENVSINIFVTGTEEIDSDFVKLIAGKNVSVTIMTQDGSVWKINGSDIDAASETAAYNLAYELSYGAEELSEELGTGISFVLRFLAPAEVNAEVLIRIGPAYARQNATLFQRDGELRRLQSVVVDSEGYAHFYLASVTEETEYYIAMNLPDAEQEAIIPENMLAEYGNPEYTEPIKYEITGRTSSWGMNLGQVMGILAAVMVTVIVVVGVTMFVLNKRKLRAGYVPQWEDEEE